MKSMLADQSGQIWLWTCLAIASGVAAGLIARRFLLSMAQRLARRSKGELDDLLVASMRGPAALILPAFAVQFALTAAPLSGPIEGSLQHGITMILVADPGWLVLTAIILMSIPALRQARRIF